MYFALKKCVCFLFLFWVLAGTPVSQAVTIRIINSQIEFDFSYGSEVKVLPIHQIQIGSGDIYNSLPNNIAEEDLIEAGHSDREVRFSFSGFNDDGYSELIIPEELQERLFHLLTSDPNTLLNRTMTCVQFCCYLNTGITQQAGVKFKYRIVKRDLKAGDFVAMRNKDGTIIHTALYISHGVYMSKFGLSNIYFHTLQTADAYYGPGLFSGIIEFTTNSYKDNNPPPPPGAGACGGASFQSAY